MRLYIFLPMRDVEINEDCQHEEQAESYSGRGCHEREEVIHYHSGLAGAQRQEDEWESFTVQERKGFRCVLVGGFWCGEAGGGLDRSDTSYMIG